jgi:hypothetical protein
MLYDKWAKLIAGSQQTYTTKRKFENVVLFDDFQQNSKCFFSHIFDIFLGWNIAHCKYISYVNKFNIEKLQCPKRKIDQTAKI